MADHAALPDRHASRGPDAANRTDHPSSGHRGAYTFAALDLGTNNCRLLIAAPTRSGFRVVDSFSRIVRLGEGLQGSGRLSEAAMDRTICALHACASRIGRRRLRGLRAVATEACRRAENGLAFLERVRQETGLSIDVISTREEAELALESCAALLQSDLTHGLTATAIDAQAATSCAAAVPGGPPRGDLRAVTRSGQLAADLRQGRDLVRSRALLFDIGGGSTEIAWVRVGSAATGGSDRRPELIGYQSLPTGVITLAELFGADAYTASGYEAMVEHVLAQLHRFERVHCIAREVGRGDVRLLGTSGTVTTLASVALGLHRYRRSAVDGIVLSRPAAQAAIATLRALGASGLRLHHCVGPDRAAYVLPGCAIFDAIQRLWPADNVVVADRGLRDGMLLRMMRDANSTRSGFSTSSPSPGAVERWPLRTGTPAAGTEPIPQMAPTSPIGSSGPREAALSS